MKVRDCVEGKDFLGNTQRGFIVEVLADGKFLVKWSTLSMSRRAADELKLISSAYVWKPCDC